MARALYDISENWQGIWFNCLDDDADLDALESALQSIEGELADKCANGIGLIQDLKYYADAMGEEIKRLSSRKKALENKIAWLKNYYLDNLSRMGKTKVLTNRGTMSVVNAGGKRPVKIDDADAVPEDFKFYIPQIDKETLRQALERGEEVKGAHLEERGKFLKIS